MAVTATGSPVPFFFHFSCTGSTNSTANQMLTDSLTLFVPLTCCVTALTVKPQGDTYADNILCLFTCVKPKENIKTTLIFNF